MIDIVSSIRKLKKEGKAMAIATVVKTWKSSPRPVGSSLIITSDGEMIGSVSGGCVEVAVVKQGLKVLETGEAIQLHFGVSDEDAWAVGLSCGGALDVFVQPFFSDSLWNEMDLMLQKDRGFSLLMTLAPQPNYSIVTAFGEIKGDPQPKTVLAEIESSYYEGDSKILDTGSEFLMVFQKKPLLLMVGSAHVTVALTEMAQMFGFETLLIDPRSTFANDTVYSIKPDEVKIAWPQQVLPTLDLNKNTYAVILSHDPKIDDEALKILLKSSVRYIGALGSRKSHAKRVERLTANGFITNDIEKIHAPIGLDIGSKMPREIALSIMAEIIKVKNSPLGD
ncbi:MAG: xanthine dehydrogenase accessory factor [Roseivirga sp.]|jgi:xanthine dehydrogenase accessory factor